MAYLLAIPTLLIHGRNVISKILCTYPLQFQGCSMLIYDAPAVSLFLPAVIFSRPRESFEQNPTLLRKTPFQFSKA